MAATASSPFHEGRALRRARQRRHVTLDDAAEATRIPRRFLEALEREDPVERFPAPVYARAFLREYGRYLSLDPDPLVEAFNAHNDVREPTLVAIPTAVVRPSRRWPGRVLAMISVAAVAALAVARLGSPGPGGAIPTQEPIHAAAAVPAAVAAVGPARPIELRSSPVPPAFHGIDVVLRTTSPCWVSATADGHLAFVPRTLAAGRSVTLSAHHTLTVRLGNAGGVSITVNGRRLKAGSAGQVVNLSFAWRNGRVVTL